MRHGACICAYHDGMASEPDSKLSLEEVIFAVALKSMRESRGFSQAEVAAAVRARGLEYFSQTTISRIESQARPARLGEAAAIANVFSMTLADFTDPDGRYRTFREALSMELRLSRFSETLDEILADYVVDVHALREIVETLQAGPRPDPESSLGQMFANALPRLRATAFSDHGERLRTAIDELDG